MEYLNNKRVELFKCNLCQIYLFFIKVTLTNSRLEIYDNIVIFNGGPSFYNFLIQYLCEKKMHDLFEV